MTMQFRIAGTFTDSLARLTGEEQKVVKTTVFDLQLNPGSPGMSFHKLDNARGKNFWSVRVSRDILPPLLLDQSRPHLGPGHQPPRRRGDEGVHGGMIIDRFYKKVL
jgi:hypothetical protein